MRKKSFIEKHQNPLIILGMHRSGTSMLSRYIDEIGYFTGVDKQQDNESLTFIKINNWILRQYNATWDNPYNYKFKNTHINEIIKKTIKKYLNSVFRFNFLGNFFFKNPSKGQTFRWGWKDPRTSITLDFWLELFAQPTLIHIYRNPLDVAQSLKQREINHKKKYTLSKIGFIKELFLIGKPGYQFSTRVENIEEGYALWKEHLKSIYNLEEKYKLKILHICYEDFLENPMLIMKRIANYLEIDVNQDVYNRFSNKVDPSNKYKFVNNKELTDFYKEIKETPLIKKLGYNTII